MLIDAASAALLVVDIQERLLPAVAAPERVVNNTRTLLHAADRLAVPVLVSEQYPQGIGRTVAGLGNLVTSDRVVEKIHFSCVREPAWASRHRALERTQAVVVGIEAHVCVLQTALDLLAEGQEVFVVGDAVSSRTTDNHAAALARLRDEGAHIVTTEMVVFEWLEQAGTPEFRELVALIK